MIFAVIMKRWLTAILIGPAILFTVAPAPAFAEETETADPPKVELVLDVSGSMGANDIGGRSRISAAKQAFNEVVDALPDETQLGIRVLGATYPGKNKAIACKDTQQIVPVGQVDRTAAKAVIATLRPTGYTPIGLALRSAAQDLGTGGSTRRIVLISDGEDTCAPPDPCDVARELAAQGMHLVVDTLGLAPDEKVRRQLLCIAAATGGSYASAETPEELTGRVKQLVDRTKEANVVPPAAVAGGAQCAQAPLLSPGVYTDREKFSEHRWYRVPIGDKQELRASVSMSLDRPLNPDYGVLLRATAADGRELVRGTDAGSGRTDVLSTGLRWSASAADIKVSPSASASDPTDATDVCLVISNSFSSSTQASSDPGIPFELTVDVVAASPTPDAPGLGKGWLLLLTLTVTGLLAGVLSGWLTRWWVATWGTNR